MIHSIQTFSNCEVYFIIFGTTSLQKRFNTFLFEACASLSQVQVTKSYSCTLHKLMTVKTCNKMGTLVSIEDKSLTNWATIRLLVSFAASEIFFLDSSVS